MCFGSRGQIAQERYLNRIFRVRAMPMLNNSVAASKYFAKSMRYVLFLHSSVANIFLLCEMLIHGRLLQYLKVNTGYIETTNGVSLKRFTPRMSIAPVFREGRVLANVERLFTYDRDHYLSQNTPTRTKRCQN